MTKCINCMCESCVKPPMGICGNCYMCCVYIDPDEISHSYKKEDCINFVGEDDLI